MLAGFSVLQSPRGKNAPVSQHLHGSAVLSRHKVYNGPLIQGNLRRIYLAGRIQIASTHANLNLTKIFTHPA